MTNEKRPSMIKVYFEEKPPDDLLVHAYGFDARGNLTATAPVGTDGTLDAKKLEGATRVFIAPAPPKGLAGGDRPTLKALERQRAYQLPSGVDSVFLPKSIIHYWCYCLISGRVVRSVSVGNLTVDMPVCKARVHICEVDPWYIIIDRIPYELLVRARDEILGRYVVEPGPFRIPPGHIPDPPPVERGAQIETRSLTAAATPSERTTMSARVDAAAPKSSLALSDVVKQIPSEVKLALSTNSELHLRQAFVAQKAYISSLLCYWWPWWFLYCDEIAVVESGDDGHFSYIYRYPCGGDKPDVYFWVEYLISGAWETVYSPPIACNTWWDYPCGTEVTIRVTDPRVPICEPPPIFDGSVVVVTTLGGGINMSRIDQTTGLIDGAPFGGDLEPHVDFGAALRNSAQQFYYRWSWRQSGTTDTFRPIESNIFRPYFIEYNDGAHNTAYSAMQLGPVDMPAGSLFKIPPVEAPSVPGFPAAMTTWVTVNPRPDSASAIFHTQNDIGFTNRSVELRLELFDHNGALINWTDAGIADKVLSPLAVLPITTLTATTDATAYRVLDGLGKVVGLQFRLQVDNNRCTAAILPLEAPGLIVDADCGFYKYAHLTDNVTVKYEARHPNNFAMFSFDIKRGPDNPVPGVGVSNARVGAAAGPYTLDGGGNYSAAFVVSSLLGTCPAAAFSEQVNVSAMATDGWGGPGNLDAHDHGAFALAPQ